MFVNCFAHRSDKVDELRGSNLVQGNEWGVGNEGASKTQEEEGKVVEGTGRFVLKKVGDAEVSFITSQHKLLYCALQH